MTEYLDNKKSWLIYFSNIPSVIILIGESCLISFENRTWYDIGILVYYLILSARDITASLLGWVMAIWPGLCPVGNP